MTALHVASSRGNKEAVTYLLRKGADSTAVDNTGRNAIHHATATNSSGMLTHPPTYTPTYTHTYTHIVHLPILIF